MSVFITDRWRRSYYQLISKEFLVYCVLFVVTALCYQFALNDSQKR